MLSKRQAPQPNWDWDRDWDWDWECASVEIGAVVGSASASGRLKVNLVGHLIALATFLISHFFLKKSTGEGGRGIGCDAIVGQAYKLATVSWLAIKMRALKLS